MKRAWTIARIAVGAGLLYYVASHGANAAAAKQLLSAVWLFPLMAIQVLSGMAIESQRMRMLFRAQGISIPFPFAYRVSAVASFFSACIPGGTGGDVMKLYYLKGRNPGKGVEIATVLLLDRVVATFALLCLIVSLALAEGRLIREPGVIRALIVTAALVAAALPCFGLICWSARFRSLLAMLPMRRYVERVSDALYAFRGHKLALVRAAALSFTGHLLLGGIFVLAGSVVLPEASPLVRATLALLGMFANALPITPGGLGVGESAFHALFTAAGFQGGAALMLAWRCCTAIQCLIGCPVYIRGIEQPEAAESVCAGVP